MRAAKICPGCNHSYLRRAPAAGESVGAVGGAVAELLAKVLSLNARAVGILDGARSTRVVARGVVVHVVVRPFLRGVERRMWGRDRGDRVG